MRTGFLVTQLILEWYGNQPDNVQCSTYFVFDLSFFSFCKIKIVCMTGATCFLVHNVETVLGLC